MADPLFTALQPLVTALRRDVHAERVGTRMRWTPDPLTDEHLRRHLDGSGPPVGLSQIEPGTDMTRVLGLDVDDHGKVMAWEDMLAVAERIHDAAYQRGFVLTWFRSRGGRGLHGYAIWDRPQHAYSVRMLAAEILADAGLRPGTGGVEKGQVEVFPKQDRVRATDPVTGDKYYGNQMILPLAGASCLLDPDMGFMDIPRDLVPAFLTWAPSVPVPVLERPARLIAAPASSDDGSLRSALAAIPSADISYEAWRNVMFGLHYEYSGSDDGLAVFLEWSAVDTARYNEDTARSMWDACDGGRSEPITGGTILGLARRAYGWVEDVSSEFEPLVAPAVLSDGTVVDPPEDLPGFARDQKGRIEATVGNLRMALDRPDVCGADIRHDDFRDAIMATPPGTNDWREFKDSDYTRLRERLERLGFKPIGPQIIRDVVGLRADETHFDAAIMWLTSIEWDGVSRVDSFAARYWGCEPSPYARAVSRYLWSALAGRVLDPGCKADMVPIMSGAQGVGKSQSTAAICPDPQFFTEVSFSEAAVDLSRKMRGCLVAEIGELHGLHTTAIERIKAFVTRTHENWVPKYKEFAVTFPRRLVFIGTSNEIEFLADDTGNRRWLPITVGACRPDDIRRDRDQLWAEAAALFREYGVCYDGAMRLASDEHGDFTMRDPWAELIQRWMDDGAPCGDIGAATVALEGRYFLSSDIATYALGLRASQYRGHEEKRLGRAMREIGFVQVRRRISRVATTGKTGKQQKWVWAQENANT